MGGFALVAVEGDAGDVFDDEVGDKVRQRGLRVHRADDSRLAHSAVEYIVRVVR